MKAKLKMVYICSPLRGNLDRNITNAVSYSKHAAGQGVLPLAPHTIFTQYLNDLIPAERQQGLTMGLELLARCDELWVYGSLISEGMRAEIQYAKEHSMPIKFQEEGNLLNNMKSFKKPHIVGYYQKTVNTKVINAVMLQYPDGNCQLTSGLLYSTPSPEYMSKWTAVERLSTSALCAMQNTIQNAIRSDSVFDVPDNRLLIQLLNAEVSDNTFTIYQLKYDSDMRNFRFLSLNNLPSGINSVNPTNYDLIYSAPLSASDTLDSIFQKFNVDHPKDYTGHSLSVSDVIVLHKDGEDTAYYVDSIGFKPILEFCPTLENPNLNSSEILEKLNRMQQETGARPYIFTECETPIISLPAEADDYLTPEEKQVAIDLISEQSQAEQNNEMEQENSGTQDFEEDCSMDMTL